MTNKEKLEKYIRLFLSDRCNVDDVIMFLENNGFYTAWASTSYHYNVKGGLCGHTLNVIEYALKLAKAFDSKVSKESIVLCAVCHDWGKMNYYVPNLLKSGNVSGTKPMKIDPALMIKNHAMRSLNMASRFFNLTESEKVCILSHDGFFENANREYMLGLDELLYIVHSADLYVARFVEPVKKYKGGDVIDL